MWLTPRRGWWLGAVLALIGLLVSNLIITVTFALGGQELASSLPVWIVITLGGIAVPLGAAFLVASIVAGQIHRVRATVGAEATASADEPRLPPRLRPRVAIVLGIVFLVVGVALDASMWQPPQTTGEFTPIENDLFSILWFLSALLTPIGVVLIPGGWLLGMLEDGTAPVPDSHSAEAPSAGTVQQ